MGKFLNKLFKLDKKHLNRIEQEANKVLEFEEKMAGLSDDELQAKTAYFRTQ